MYYTPRYQKGIFKIQDGPGRTNLSQGFERKSSSMQKKEKERKTGKKSRRERGRDEGRAEEGTGEGKEVKVRRRPVLPAHPRFRATAFLPSLPRLLTLPPCRSPFLSPPLLSLFAFTPTVYEDSPIVCRFAHVTSAPAYVYGRTHRGDNWLLYLWKESDFPALTSTYQTILASSSKHNLDWFPLNYSYHMTAFSPSSASYRNVSR